MRAGTGPSAMPSGHSVEENSMNGKQAIKQALNSTQNILMQYVSDLSDTDLLVRPAPTANHIAWQLGHLTSSERGMMAGQEILPDFPGLPAGFKEQHDKSTAAAEPAKGF